MKRKLLLSLFLFSLSIFIKNIAFADQQEDLPSVKKYDNISMVESKKATLSWMSQKKVDSSKLFTVSIESDKLELLSNNKELGIVFLGDRYGNNIIVIQGVSEVLLLTYSKEEVRRPYNLLEFKVEDHIVSKEQFNYIKDSISIYI